MDIRDHFFFMSEAIEQAEEAYSKGQLPIGAVLVVGNEIIDKNGNSQVKSGGFGNHAENILILKNQRIIRDSRRESLEVVLYSTLEPCLQCFGTAVQNRITRIVYACPDPIAGSTHIKPPTNWYANKWPEIVRGPFARESYDLLMEFMRGTPKTWKNVIPAYENIAKTL